MSKRRSKKRMTKKQSGETYEPLPDKEKYVNPQSAKKIMKVDGHMSTKQRREQEQIVQRRREIARMMVEYGYNDITMATILGVSTSTVRKDREWLHQLWLKEAVYNVDLAKARLARRKNFVLEEARMAWEKSKDDTVKKSKRNKTSTGGEGGGGSEEETSEVATTNDGNAEFLRLFDKMAEDLAELEGYEKDKITTQINITMPSLPSDFSKYGIGHGEVESQEVEEANVVEDSGYGVDIDALEEEDIRNRQKDSG